jgi:hypothetical protein
VTSHDRRNSHPGQLHFRGKKKHGNMAGSGGCCAGGHLWGEILRLLQEQLRHKRQACLNYREMIAPNTAEAQN